MSDKILEKLSNEQLMALVHHFIGDSPMGVVILNDAFEQLYINQEMKKILQTSSEVEDKLFGNIFMCKTVSDSEMLCGTRFQCVNCKIRNSIISANLQNRIIKNVKVKHTFIKQGEEIIKWFDMSVFPLVVERKSYSIVMLNDQTDWMRNHIASDLESILETRSFDDEQKRFKNRIIQQMKLSGNMEAHFVSILPISNWHVTNSLKRDLIQSFTSYTLKNVDHQTIHSNYHEGELLLYFSEHEEAYVQQFLSNIKQFCEYNYDQQCQLAHKVMKIDFKSLVMTDKPNEKELENAIGEWISELDNMPATGLETHSQVQFKL